jgi:uncharacterized protein YjiS (DUF1127 family)
MLHLAFALIPSLAPEQRDAEEGFLGKLILWTRQRIRYHRALHELHQLDDRDLDDLNIARVDFPELAWRHATGAEPLARLQG